MCIHVCVAEVNEEKNYNFPLSLSCLKVSCPKALDHITFSILQLVAEGMEPTLGCSTPLTFPPLLHKCLGWGCLSGAKTHNCEWFQRSSENNMNKNKKKEDCSLNKKGEKIILRNLCKCRLGF